MTSVDLLAFVLLTTSPALATYDDLTHVRYVRCYDGDTCYFDLPWLPGLFGQEIGVRLAGIDTPEMRGNCEQEKALAVEARDMLIDQLSHAKQITLRDPTCEKYFRIVAPVVVDGIDLSEVLIAKGLAVSYDGGTKTKDWCE